MKKQALQIIFILAFIPNLIFGQEKKVMDESIYDIWNKISSEKISNDGNWVAYHQGPENKDKTLILKSDSESFSFERASNSKFDASNNFISFLIKAPMDTIRHLKRIKTDEDKMPKDTLGFFHFGHKKLIKIPNVKSFAVPKEKGGVIAYLIKRDVKNEKDTSETNDAIVKSQLIIKNFSGGSEDTLDFVDEYHWSDDGSLLAVKITESDSTENEFLKIFETNSRKIRNVHDKGGKISKIKFDENGNHLAFLVRVDSLENDISAELHLWKKSSFGSTYLASSSSSFLPDQFHISKEGTPRFSKNSKFLFFGIGQEPLKQDTSLLDEEIVNLEIWSYTDDVLHTEQNVKLKDELKRSYSYAYDIEKRKFISLGSEEVPNIMFSSEESNIALGYNQKKYHKNFSWEGINYKDVYVYDLSSSKKKLIAEKEEGNMRLSPNGKYAFWYCRPDSSWKTYNVKKGKIKKVAGNETSIFYDELNDRPMLPYSYRYASWTKDDEYLILYDRYDLWLVDPSGKKDPTRLTKGRENKISYRLIDLDPEENWISLDQKMLLYQFDEKDKSSGYAYCHAQQKKVEIIEKADLSYSRRVWKAKDADQLLFTKESFQLFPDLIKTDLSFENQEVISDVNPQQSEYKWGHAEQVEWKSKTGKLHQGMIFFPEDFDPKKKYPLMVNFYEKSSNGLHRHRAPNPHRSTINYAIFVNKGYVIFNPDVHYEIGYPGRSCYNSVMSGLDHILEKGFIDEENIGVQGHSWGGYQVAHLLTKTDIFKCAESGAPVVNMVSAYGGIRWRSGLSRMFQYEHTQSRLGASLWENKELYLENSPIFNLDKVNTPVLILHNDKDGAVPWYQGIEYFVGMRRLGKPAWMLNYNDEPHWPLKLQNRIDFNTRMHQFFDHYLLGKPMPQWMKRGIPAKEKGIKQGLEFDK